MIARFLAELIYTFPTHLSSLRAKTKPTKELKKKKLSFSLHLHCTLAVQLNGRFRNGKNPELAIYTVLDTGFTNCQIHEVHIHLFSPL